MKDRRMLLRVQMESFKSIAQLDELELGQLTVVVGENSAGKSSLLQAIVMMSQIARSDEVGSDIPLYGDEIDLGDFKDVVHAGLGSDEITVALTLREVPLRLTGSADSAEDPAPIAPVGEFRWEISIGPPYQRHRRASIRHVVLDSSVSGESLSASSVNPRSSDPGEEARASQLRELLVRSILLARASNDTSLELAARSAFSRQDAAVFEGGVRGTAPGPDDESAREKRLPYIEVESGLPALALEATANRWAAARAFVALSSEDELPAETLGVSSPQGSVEQSTDDGENDELEEVRAAFTTWLHSLDDALRDRNSVSVPPTSFRLQPALRSQPVELATELLRFEPPGLPLRDQLQRFSADVVGAGELVREALSRRVRLLGPLRNDPSPTYQSGVLGTGITPLGKKGEYTVAYLDEHGSDRVICPLMEDPDDPNAPTDDERSLKSAVDYWLHALEIAQRGQLALLGRNLEFSLVDQQTGRGRDLTAMGVGASQILPVVVLCLAAQPGDLVLLEQPELHLHPGPQQKLGDFLLGITRTGRQLLVETHSEYLLNRLRRRMVEQRLDQHPESLKLLYATREQGATTFQELRPNSLGAFEGGWPEGFFDQSPDEAEKIVRAAAERRRAERTTEK